MAKENQSTRDLLQIDGENAVLAALGSWVTWDEFARLQHFYPLIGERSCLLHHPEKGTYAMGGKT